MTEWLSIILIWGGVGFFVAGTIALLRLPDLYTRLHALTKADNLGLGLLVAGLLWQVDSLLAGFKYNRNQCPSASPGIRYTEPRPAVVTVLYPEPV